MCVCVHACMRALWAAGVACVNVGMQSVFSGSSPVAHGAAVTYFACFAKYLVRVSPHFRSFATGTSSCLGTTQRSRLAGVPPGVGVRGGDCRPRPPFAVPHPALEALRTQGRAFRPQREVQVGGAGVGHSEVNTPSAFVLKCNMYETLLPGAGVFVSRLLPLSLPRPPLLLLPLGLEYFPLSNLTPLSLSL